MNGKKGVSQSRQVVYVQNQFQAGNMQEREDTVDALWTLVLAKGETFTSTCTRGRLCHLHGSEALVSLARLCQCQQYTFTQGFLHPQKSVTVILIQSPWVAAIFNTTEAVHYSSSRALKEKGHRCWKWRYSASLGATSCLLPIQTAIEQ